MEFLYALGLIFIAFLLSFVLINIRHIITGKEFRGTCSSNNPMLKKKVGECSVCGRPEGEECALPEVEKS
jgi:hypothetical protein